LLDRQQGLFKDQKKQSVKGSESNLQREFQKSEGLKSSALLIDEIKNPQHLTGVQTVLAKQSNLFFSQKFRR
jgi:hypothetical protein